jgi:hypothetical protein
VYAVTVRFVFEDDRYSKDAPRIYDLPGRFVEKKK